MKWIAGLARLAVVLAVVLGSSWTPGGQVSASPPSPSVSASTCTPGYWKNHTESWPASYAPSQVINTVYNIPTGLASLGAKTLLQGLSFQGGSSLSGAAEILLRASIAALLNGKSGVVSDTNAALSTNNRNRILALATALDNYNNSGTCNPSSVVQTPKLTLTKSVTETSFNAAGVTLHYTLIATNGGNVTLTGVTITDAKLGALTCTPAQPATLAPGATLKCTGAYVTTQADVNARKVDNTANATGVPPSGPALSVTASASVPVVQTNVSTCTPGYWKNHTESWPASYAPSQLISAVYTIPTGLASLGAKTLLQGLSFQGGSTVSGAAEILLRASIAALLNGKSGVVSDTNAALSTNDRSTILTLATALDNYNNSGPCNPASVVPPTITVTGVVSGRCYSDTVTPVIGVSDNLDPSPTVTITLTHNGNPPASYTSGSPISAEGSYTLFVLATDLSGNTATQTMVFTIDLTPPVVTDLTFNLNPYGFPPEHWLWVSLTPTSAFTSTGVYHVWGYVTDTLSIKSIAFTIYGPFDSEPGPEVTNNGLGSVLYTQTITAPTVTVLLNGDVRAEYDLTGTVELTRKKFYYYRVTAFDCPGNLGFFCPVVEIP